LSSFGAPGALAGLSGALAGLSGALADSCNCFSDSTAKFAKAPSAAMNSIMVQSTGVPPFPLGSSVMSYFSLRTQDILAGNAGAFLSMASAC
jgi:hypothetical protein